MAILVYFPSLPHLGWEINLFVKVSTKGQYRNPQDLTLNGDLFGVFLGLQVGLLIGSPHKCPSEL